MSYINQRDIVLEYINFLRNSDILSPADRGVSTLTEEFTSTKTGIETFKLTKTDCKNVRKVEYNSKTLTYLLDYSIDLDSAEVSLNSVVADKLVKITYDHGPDRIHIDYPRQDLSLNSYPRIGFGVYGFNTIYAGFGNVLKSNWRFDIRVYTPNKQQADELIDIIRTKNIDAYVSLNCANRIYPGAVRDLGVYDTDKGRNKIYVKGIDIMAINNYEVN